MEERSNRNSREAIFESIRGALAASRVLDAKESELHHAPAAERALPSVITHDVAELVELFKESLDAVDGHCIVVENRADVVQALFEIINKLQGTYLKAKRIAVSDSPEIERLVNLVDADVDSFAVAPTAAEVFNFDVGISNAQAGIAETGTLVLDSSRERNRLVSLVPPVHIAILNASNIVQTLGEALSALRQSDEVSPIVTLVTGPSRTADIELTLAIGVHGPQELYVIVNKNFEE
jgi:L-lactate dehydrogenase complex protein LldG